MPGTWNVDSDGDWIYADGYEATVGTDGDWAVGVPTWTREHGPDYLWIASGSAADVTAAQAAAVAVIDRLNAEDAKMEAMLDEALAHEDADYADAP